MKIFFSGPLTNLKDPGKTKAFYMKLDTVAARLGYDTFWAFRSGTDPIQNPDVTPKEVYLRDINELKTSNLMIAYVGEASTGTGVEIEYARQHSLPVVLLFEKNRKVSRMARGCPSVVKEIQCTTEEDACAQMEQYLTDFKKQL